tara:strand:- start:135 stop:1319 length:1185 start_codon:yes stop_codon:yes gene_type:complete
MEHIEDNILNAGVDGARQTINYLRALRDMLAGDVKAPVNVTVKWDGAPAIFAGQDPSDGKFFVAKKGIFNKNPKVYKTDADVDADTSGDLNTKLKLALKHLPALGIEGVIQGDFLYSKDDIRKETIDGASYTTFHPNTIVYAIPEKSELAKKIRASQLGVVWHTTYRGDSFESMSASFGEEIASKLKKSKAVWSVDAMYKDVSGQATMTKDETAAVTKILSDAGKKFNTIKRSTFDGITDNPERLMRVKTFINTKVRAGERITNPSRFVDDMVDYIYSYYQKEIDKVKTDNAKAAKVEKRKEILSYFSNTPKPQIVALFEMYNLIVDAKLYIIKKLDRAKTVGTFLKTADGFKVTEQEGFVAIDRMGKNAVKLVDRLGFSSANFSTDIIKGWQK